jgi:hypothetical protein
MADRTSEVFAEIHRPGRQPVRTTYEAYTALGIDEVPHVRFFVRSGEGEIVYITGSFVELVAAVNGYRQARSAVAS